MHAAIDEVLAEYYDDVSFATGIVARLATGSGRLEWSCAGHPRPLLLRGRKVVAELSCDPVLPFGLGDMTPKPVIEELEPDDMLLLYTDGVTEARTADGELFGLDRLADLLEREAASGRTAEELLRRLARSVLDHQAGGLRDDATLLLVQWTGPGTRHADRRAARPRIRPAPSHPPRDLLPVVRGHARAITAVLQAARSRGNIRRGAVRRV